MSSSLFIRPVQSRDYDTLMALARETGPGFTSLPEDADLMHAKIEKSLQSFARQLDSPLDGRYFMLAECSETGEIAGCSAVKGAVGLSQPFFNYRIVSQTQSSTAVDRRFTMDTLVLTNEFERYAEVGSLFLRPHYRGGGNGRLLAQSRYMLIATEPQNFGDRVLAEMRGIIDESGYSPFWESMTKQFFRMEYAEADRLSVTTNNQFIMDLMPRHPIYTDLLPKHAQMAIGQCHPEGRGAYNMLAWEGLIYDNIIDIFDGGPIVSGAKNQIRTIRESYTMPYKVVAHLPENASNCLIARTKLDDFRSMHAPAIIDPTNQYLLINEQTQSCLRLARDDKVRIWSKENTSQ